MKELTTRIVNFEMYGKLCSARLCFISRLRSLYIYAQMHSRPGSRRMHVVRQFVNKIPWIKIYQYQFIKTS